MTTDRKAADVNARPPANFYTTDGTPGPETDELAEARSLEGLEDEISMLRVKLKRVMNDEPADFALVLRGVEVLIRAVTAQYRLSPRAGKNMAAHLSALLNDLGDQILPADH